MRIVDALLAEFEHEAHLTRELLRRVPEDRLAWAPHPRSMTLGQLALHVAQIPGLFTQVARAEAFSVPDFSRGAPQAGTKSEILEALESSIMTVGEYLGSLDDETAFARWSLVHEETPVMTLPRIAVVRALLMNHFIHHRGQLTVYLRLLEVKLPVLYGASGDENPFG